MSHFESFKMQTTSAISDSRTPCEFSLQNKLSRKAVTVSVELRSGEDS